MIQTPLRALSLAALVLALSACGGGEEPADKAGDDAATASAAPAPSAPATAAPAAGGGSCETSGFGGPMEQQLGLQAGNRGKLPADFPEPPAGAKLCGARPDMDITYFAGGGAQEAVLTHYRTALTGQGYTVDANDSGMEQGDMEMSFRKEGAANGSVYADKEGTFSVMYTALR